MDQTPAKNEPGFLKQHSIRIGCAGWSIPGQAADNFPSDGTHLQRYSKVFHCCEINSSFYRPHRKQTWHRWANSVPAEFRFSLKAPKAITHDAALDCDPDLLRGFLQQTEMLGEKLGPVLSQMPPGLAFNPSREVRFFELLRSQFAGEVVCEPRHASWFEDKAEGLLRKFHIGRVAADPARFPTAANPSSSSPVAYFRLHGSPRQYYSAYSETFLDNLALRLTGLALEKPVWCIFDNTALGFATFNALFLNAMVGMSATSSTSL